MEKKCLALNNNSKKTVFFPQKYSLPAKLLKPKISKRRALYLECSKANDFVNVDFIYIAGF